MLDLDWSTPPAWAAAVAQDPLALLVDHAHCELKAAASARSLLDREERAREIARELEEIEAEENEHYARVMVQIDRLGGRDEPFRGNPYAKGLLRGARDGGAHLLDRLIIAALIEARSFERFQLLARQLPDAQLAELYRGLLASEAGHLAFFLRAARSMFPAEIAESRIAELRAHEARVISRLPFTFRMHSGPPR